MRYAVTDLQTICDIEDAVQMYTICTIRLLSIQLFCTDTALCTVIHSPAPFPLLSEGITSGGRQDRGLVSRFKAEGPRLDSASAVPFSSKRLWFVDSLVVTLSLTINETLKCLLSLSILMQESFWWWQCSDRYYALPLPPPPYPFPLLPVPNEPGSFCGS